MRKSGFMVTKRGVREILPKTYKFDAVAHRRHLFLKMINFTLAPEARFDPRSYDLSKENLRHIFTKKILSFFQFANFRPEKSGPVKRILTDESLLFRQFFALSHHPKARWMAKGIVPKQDFEISKRCRHPACELIATIFDGRETKLMIDLDRLFAKVVYERIKLKNDPKTVSMEYPYIHIRNGSGTTRVVPIWKSLNPKSLPRHRRMIDRQIEKLDTEVDRCFVVVPKREDFRRHLKIVYDEDARTEMKLVPYSFTFCDRKGCRKR